MHPVDDLKRLRVERLTETNRCIGVLCEMIAKHAGAVDGRDRTELRALSVDAARQRDAINAVLAAGPDAVMTLGSVELTDMLREVATAGAVALQILGGRLARREIWGGPFDGEMILDTE